MGVIRLVNGERFHGRIIEDRGDVLVIEVYKKNSKTGDLCHVCVRTIPFQNILSIDYY